MPKTRFNIDRKIVHISLLLVSLFPAILAVVETMRHWVSLPYWDEWYTPGLVLISYVKGTVGFPDLFLQHNESRKLFPRLIYLALAKLHGWDVRDGMVISLVEVAAMCGLLFWLFLRTPGASSISSLVALTLTTYLCFSPVQYENFLWGLQWEPFFVGMAAILAAVVNLSRLRFEAKTVVNAIIALFATYTFANGMLLWLLAIPLPTERAPVSKPTRITCYSIYALIGVAAIALYFVDYKRPVEHPTLYFSLVQVIHYIILWVGGYYNSKHAWPFAIGGIVLTLWLSAVANAIFLIRHGAGWRRFYPWLLISAYALTSALITAIGRSGFGVEQALSSRYTTFSLFLYLGLVGTTFALYCYYQDRNASGKRVILSVAIAATALSIPLWRSCLHDGRQFLARTAERNPRLLCALEWIDVLPTNPDLKLIFPHQNVLRSRANILAKAKLFRSHLVSARVFDQLRKPGPATDVSHGQLEQAAVHENSLIASGWAWRPNTGPKPDCVLVVLRLPNGEVRPLGVTPLRGTRSSIDSYYRREAQALAFYGTIPDSISLKGSIEAWAVDSALELAWPLGGAVQLSALNSEANHSVAREYRSHSQGKFR